MSESVIITYKNLGETPLECLERVRLEQGISADIPMTYAGRLDPIAEGVMILLVGEECKKKEQYLGLPKTYEFEILVGFETDTYDLLGMVASSGNAFSETFASPADEITGPRGKSPDAVISSAGFANTLALFVGTFTQKYPSFSSKTVGGKQLFQLSKDDELPSQMPEHEVTITRLEQTGSRTVRKEDLQKEIERRISLVHGDFRQTEILASWQVAFKNSNKSEYTIISCTLDCSSGTYVRQLVADLSVKLGTSLVTYSIARTKVGGL